MAVTQSRDKNGQLVYHSSVTNKDYPSEAEAKKAESGGSKLKNQFNTATKNNANASGTDIKNTANTIQNNSATPSTGNMVDGWYSWIDPYSGKGQSNKLTKSEAEGLKKQMAEQYPGYNIQLSLHNSQGDAQKAAASKKGEVAKPKKEIEVPQKKNDNGSAGAQPQTEELNKFFASLTYTDEKGFDEALNKIDDKIKELQAQVSTLNGQSKEIAIATLNEAIKMREEYIAKAEKSNDSGIVDRAKQAKDSTQSPEQGNANKQKVAQKVANGEALTPDELDTLDANRTDIAAMVTDIKGGDYNAIQDEINKKVEYEKFKNDANKKVEDLANSKSDVNPNAPDLGDGAGTTNPPGTGNSNLNTDTTGGGGNNDKLAEFWKAFKAGAFRAYPMLQAIGDALSQQAKMTMDRANILTGQGSDLSVYEGKDPSEYFFNEDYEYRQAFLDAEAGNYEGVKELLLKGKVTLDQVAAALKLTEEDVEKIFGQEIRGREADTVSKELSNEETLKNEIKELGEKIAEVDKDINALQYNDFNTYLEVLDKYVAIYEGLDTTGSTQGTTTTKNDTSGGNLNLNAGNGAVSAGGGINGSHGESTSEASNASRNKDLGAIAALPKGEDFAKKSMEERNKANDELIANLKNYKQSLLDQQANAQLELDNIRANQNAAQTGGKNTILIPSSRDMTTAPTTAPTTTTTTDTSGGNGNATEQQ